LTTGLELIALAGLLVIAAAIGRLYVRAGHRPAPAPPPALADGDDQRVFIPMPDALKTRDEMVAWMIGDMPRIVEELARAKS
jgi:hypothetical protein